MKVQVNRVELLTLLEKLKPAVPNRSTLPICTSVLLKAGEKKLTITGNNLEFALVGECKGKVEKSGAVCLEFAKLLLFVKGARGEVLTIETKSKVEKWWEGEGVNLHRVDEEKDIPRSKTIRSAVVTLNGSSLSIKAQAPEDFPPAPEVQGEKVLAYNLTEGLDKVAYSMATEECRPVLCGVLFRPKYPLGGGPHIVNLAAADGFRLAVAPVKVKGELAEMTVPAAVITALKKLMPGTVAITQKLGEGGVLTKENPECKPYAAVACFEQKGLKLVCNLILGTFPDYEQLFWRTTHAVTVDRDELLDAVKTVLSIKSNGDNKIRLQTKKGKLLVSFTDDEDKCETTLPARGSIKIALNAKYLCELLRRMDDKVTIRTSTPSSPLKVISQGATHMVMPMFDK